MKKFFLCLVVLLLWIVGGAYALPVFPGAQGFGSGTVAGRGGTIYRVDTLDDNTSAPVLNPDGTYSSSLRAAVDASGARTIVFEVGGVINLGSNLLIDDPYVTVAGQTAPSPGINLHGAGIRVRTHDVLVQHLRVRVGDDPGGPSPSIRDAVEVLGTGTYNVVIDHVSGVWAVDEVFSTWYALNDVTFSNCIMAEGLWHSIHPEGNHSYGFLLGDNAYSVTIVGSLIASNYGRNPLTKASTSLEFINNMVYNEGGPYNFMGIGAADYTSDPAYATIIGNAFIAGPNTPADTPGIEVEGSAPTGTQVYIDDNIATYDVYVPSSKIVSTIPISSGTITPYSSAEVETNVLASAGARPADRDTVDTRIVAYVANRTGDIIDSQSEVGGFPSLSSTAEDFPVPANPNNDDDSDGYTNLEEILHQYAADVEGTPDPPAPPDPIQHSTTFLSYSTGAQPSDWATYGAAGAWTVDADTSGIDDKILSHDDVSSGRYLLLWEQPGIVNDSVQVMAKVRINGVSTNTGPGSGRVVICGGGIAGNESGYILGARSNLDGNIGIAKYVNGVYSELGFSSGHSFITTGTWIWLKFDFDTTTRALSGRVWEEGQSEPGTWHMQVNDTSLSLGRVGVSDWAADSKADYDFFSVGTGGLAAPDPPPEQGQVTWDHPVAIQGTFVIQ